MAAIPRPPAREPRVPMPDLSPSFPAILATHITRRLATRQRIVSDFDRAAWQTRARLQRYVAYAITSGVGPIGLLMMSTQPELW